MVLLTFADNSTCDIPIEELRKIPYFKDMPKLTDDSHKLDLSFNKRFTYKNLIKCIAFSEPIDDSCEELMDYFCIDNKFYDKNLIEEAFNIDLNGIKSNNFNDLIILRCQLDKKYLNENWYEIINLPIDIIKQCITKENVNIQSDTKNTALMRASNFGYTETVKLLIEAGANINHQNNYNTTALISATRNGHIKIVKLLIEAGANVNIQHNIRGVETALIIASYKGYTEIVKLLNEAGAN